MDKVRVLLVDDHTVVRRGLRKILESTREIEVVGEVGDGAEAVTVTSALHPDVVLMDVSLPGLNGIEATRRITTATPGTQVLMLSMHADEQYVRQSISAGAKGYLLKDTDDEDLVEAVLAVRRGETYYSGTLARAVSVEGSRSPDVLSPREREVLAMICSGRTNREVAEVLGLSVNTVETHRKHIIDKLDLHSTAELVRYAIRHGMVN
ncbi:MAG: response regulator transcription factor [Deltaproteobacteria bacterium]|nr:response regulator transcription factor [Deltaproteobacteria bacterium]MBI3387524.1 response regulator transcription factor [Deltaproteobacteria bacterium]